MRIRTILAAAAAPAALAAVLLGTAGQASAATTQHLTGSVVLSGPAQFESFNNIGGPGNGSVSYTNFTYASPGSGVWTLGLNGPVHLSFGLGGGSYDHTMDVTGINVTGLNSYTFTGTGTYSEPGYTWTATGSVTGSQVTMHIQYTGTNAGYSVDLTAAINADGSLTGSATDSNLQQLSLTGSAGDATEVLSYTASVNGVQFGTDSVSHLPIATFSFTTPATPTLPATPVTVNVTDGGNPGPGHDQYAHNGTSYTVTGGNLTVH